MNLGGNAALDLAAERADQERNAGIARARAALQETGRCECIECGHTILAARLRSYPAATR